MQKSEFQLIATTGLGMEQLLAAEIASLGGADIQVTGTSVEFRGTLELGYRVCLWSRIANRVLYPLKTFEVPHAEGLYHGVRSIHWTEHLGTNKTFAIDFTGDHPEIRHSRFGALKSKDAIVDQLRSLRGNRPDVQVAQPDVRIHIHVVARPSADAPRSSSVSTPRMGRGPVGVVRSSLVQEPSENSANDSADEGRSRAAKPRRWIPGRPDHSQSESAPSRGGERSEGLLTRTPIRVREPLAPSSDRYFATVSIDLSGESLHRRGYRQPGFSAPMKENLAAALLMQAGWGSPSRGESKEQLSFPGALLDPMCGSGTLVIEAGMIAANIAPGLGRTYFGFQGWLPHDGKLWQKLISEAQEVQIRNPKQIPPIVGYDKDFRAIRLAIEGVRSAGLLKIVHVEKKDLAACEPIAKKGILIVNPPYGTRIGETEELKTLYHDLGDLMKQRFEGWEGYIFTGNRELAKSVGLKASRKIPFFNGAIECRLLKYQLYKNPAPKTDEPK